jgi:hypothetical protein
MARSIKAALRALQPPQPSFFSVGVDASRFHV